MGKVFRAFKFIKYLLNIFVSNLSYRYKLYLLNYTKKGLLIEENVKIIRLDKFSVGDNVIIHSGCTIYCCGAAPEYRTNGKIRIGDNVELGWGCVLHGGGADIVLESDSTLGPCVIILSESSNHIDPNTLIRLQRKRMGNVTIRKGAFIGAGSIILPGVTIGEGAVVGAGSVVTKDIPDFSICVGVPAKQLNSRKQL